VNDDSQKQVMHVQYRDFMTSQNHLYDIQFGTDLKAMASLTNSRLEEKGLVYVRHPKNCPFPREVQGFTPFCWVAILDEPEY